MKFEEIRRLTITALFADDTLSEQLVLKGGNALTIVHKIGDRTSLDLDFSMAEDFPDLEEAKRKIFATLRDRFDSAGYVVIDERLEVKPDLRGAEDKKPWWGGYELKFKLIAKDKYDQMRATPNKLSINALVTGLRQERTFKVDLSKHEFTDGKVKFELDDYVIYVYTPEMIALEKLRAICQQMSEYPHKSRSTPRARDFFDIHLIVTKLKIDLATAENLSLLENIFEAKEVPLELLDNVDAYRELHRQDWEDVKASVGKEIEVFDFYFDFVLEQISHLKLLWIKNPPV